MKKKISPQEVDENHLARVGATGPGKSEIPEPNSVGEIVTGNLSRRDKSADDISIGETEDMLVDAIDEMTSAFAEIKYAKQRDLLNSNIDEIKGMIEDAKFQLNVILRELEEVK